jgi:hypothetical protein
MTAPDPQITEEVFITINGQTASKRTRNRVKEHGPEFFMIPNPNRVNQVLLKSINNKWFGWLPLDEIKIKKIKIS